MRFDSFDYLFLYFCAFVPLLEGTDIDSILCIKHNRKTDAAGTFSFKNHCFQILDAGFPIINARREITVLLHPRYGIRAAYGGQQWLKKMGATVPVSITFENVTFLYLDSFEKMSLL